MHFTVLTTFLTFFHTSFSSSSLIQNYNMYGGPPLSTTSSSSTTTANPSKRTRMRIKTSLDITSRKLRKNAQSRQRAARLREKVESIKIKVAAATAAEAQEDEQLLEEEDVKLYQTVEDRRARKNNRSRERAMEKKAEVERILAKPECERTKEELEAIDTAKAAKKRKNEGDRLRRERLKSMGLKSKPPGVSIISRPRRKPLGISTGGDNHLLHHHLNITQQYGGGGGATPSPSPGGGMSLGRMTPIMHHPQLPPLQILHHHGGGSSETTYRYPPLPPTPSSTTSHPQHHHHSYLPASYFAELPPPPPPMKEEGDARMGNTNEVESNSADTPRLGCTNSTAITDQEVSELMM